MSTDPTLEVEKSVLEDGARWIVALDEVGRGALAGPVSVGAACFDAASIAQGVPAGIRDSKLVSEKKRPALAALAEEWACAARVGSVEASEIDEIGILPALGLAAQRAIVSLMECAPFRREDTVILLDGNADYVSRFLGPEVWDVRTIVKGDRDCATIAAASLVAKVLRDEHMVTLDEELPAYAWQKNKGYASVAHREAIMMHGLTSHHRRSWAIGPTEAEALFTTA